MPSALSAADVRAVFDTNVLISGLLWRGPSHSILQQVRAGNVTLISSPSLLSELSAVIRRKKFAPILAGIGVDPDSLINELSTVAEIINPPGLPVRASRDSDDDQVLAVAVAAKADIIVSGDLDLLDLQIYGNIPITTPAQALARFER